MKKRILYLFLLIIVVAGFVGQACKSKKHILSAAPIEAKVDDKLFVDIVDNQFEFNTFSSRVSLSLSSGTRSLSSKSNLKILRDRALQLSIQPLFGVEMLRLYIDTDSIVLLDRMNKRYVKESLNDVKKHYPVGFDFKTVQSLLTNRIFLSGHSEVSYGDYVKFSTSRVSDLYYQINSVDKESGIEYSFSIDGNDRVALAHINEPVRKYSMDWIYDEFMLRSDKIFPHRMNVKLSTSKRKADIGMEFSGIVLDEEFDLAISIPSSYSRADFNSLIKILTDN